uniref:CWH43-like N-terminal domain-containing protein n=1 Tax=Amphilophus citrinellus TaxID=61819 RepID=A0A3Q0SIW3_AMPCI
MQLWAVLPVCLAVFGTAGIWTVFAVAVTNESVNLIEGILYISQCGTYNLQSCLFSQICNICCFLALWVVVICFQLVRDYGDHRKASISSIVLGFSPAWESQSVLMSIHVVVAILAFFLGLAYFWARLKHILPQGGTIELFRAFCVRSVGTVLVALSKITRGMLEMGILGPQCPAMSQQHSFTYSMLCDVTRGGL